MLLQRLSMLYIPDFFSQLLYGPCESAQSVAGHSETATRACSCGFVAKPWILYHLILNEVIPKSSQCQLRYYPGSIFVYYLKTSATTFVLSAIKEALNLSAKC